jgi:hypothetical protein
VHLASPPPAMKAAPFQRGGRPSVMTAFWLVSVLWVCLWAINEGAVQELTDGRRETRCGHAVQSDVSYSWKHICGCAGFPRVDGTIWSRVD